jgi:arabinofuranosyltransferase
MMFGILPVLVWTTFSLIYYGFPFSNTSYAKLGNGISFSELVSQGFVYLLHVIDRDPLTIFVMTMGILIGFTRHSYFKALSLGLVFYNLYIVYIGGDFMEGRFYTVPFLISLMIIGYTLQALSFRQTVIVSAIPILLLGSINIPANILSGSTYPATQIQPDGIADERAY